MSESDSNRPKPGELVRIQYTRYAYQADRKRLGVVLGWWVRGGEHTASFAKVLMGDKVEEIPTHAIQHA